VKIFVFANLEERYPDPVGIVIVAETEKQAQEKLADCKTRPKNWKDYYPRYEYDVSEVVKIWDDLNDDGTAYDWQE